ncbi:MAG: nitroreductase family protein [Anaerolineae bacterium]|jgi:nitroreductase|nr:nitroreductase family protein [Anaerolineae bacterium]MDX9833278.1 nitroreductase family protein [Anaerolineae bacterium]
MDFWQVLEARYSVRRFDPATDVPPETVERILQAAIRAPSAGNRQPWHFYVVRDAALRSGLAAAAFGQEYVAQAPVAIVVCADADQSAARYHERGRELYCLQDTAAAATHILLAAVALGLGSCWIGAFDEGQAAAVLELPSRHRPVAILPIGRPAGERGGATSREPLESVATFLG